MSTTTTNFTDASFYELVHQLVGTRGEGNVNRRQAPRHEFPGKQRIAPYIPGQFPPDSAFCEVQCQDLSTGGVSFFCRTLPGTNQLAVHLASESIALWLLAEICHTTEIHDERGPMFLVGCRFVGRLDRPCRLRT